VGIGRVDDGVDRLLGYVSSDRRDSSHFEWRTRPPSSRALHSNLSRSTLHGALESAPVDGRERILKGPDADASAGLAHGALDARVADDDGCRVVAMCVGGSGPSGKHLESLPGKREWLASSRQFVFPTMSRPNHSE
jgi:hypothetical protein